MVCSYSRGTVSNPQSTHANSMGINEIKTLVRHHMIYSIRSKRSFSQIVNLPSRSRAADNSEREPGSAAQLGALSTGFQNHMHITD